MKPNNFYKMYYKCELDIKGLKITLESLERQKNNIINQCGPGEVKAINYAVENSKKVINEIEQLEMLNELINEIKILQKTIKIKEKEFKDLNDLIKSIYEKSKMTEYKVFIGTWIEHKTADQLGLELNYATHYIYNIISRIKKQMSE